MPEQAGSSPIVLQNERLRVEIAPPGTVYRGSRFDWSGFVTQVTLDGRHTFCVPESLVPGRGSGGIGLCGEFGIHEPIGFEEAKPGDKFPKLGVGLLTRPDEQPYDFFRPYAIEPFPMSVSVCSDTASFVAGPLDCRGYAARLTKTVTVSGNRLKVDYRLDNVGSKPLETTEYSHNFLGFDNRPVGPDYRLRFPYRLEIAEVPEILDVREGEIRWRRTPEGDFYCRPGGFPGGEVHRWELVHEPTGLGMREESLFAVERVCLWGTAHVVSPEVFVRISVKPGETQTWSRCFEFFRVHSR